MSRVEWSGAFLSALDFDSLHHIQDTDDIKKHANWEWISREYQKALDKLLDRTAH